MKTGKIFIAFYASLALASTTLLVTGREPEPASGKRPKVDFTTQKKGLKATFTNTSTNATFYSWDFCDVSKGTVSKPVHTYAKAGKYTVSLTATNNKGTGNYSKNIQVEAMPVETVKVSPKTLSLDVGQTKNLTATVALQDATNAGVTWTSNDPTVATVDATGTVPAVAQGSATITTTSNDDETIIATVTVTEVHIKRMD